LLLSVDRIIAGRYRLVRPLARGGMGVLWIAEHTELGVSMALKFGASGTPQTADWQRRFREEARSTARLKHPHIVQVHDFGVDEDTPYIALELLEGETLRQRTERSGPLPLSLAVDLMVQAAGALAVAHAAGLVHRDIKPSNLFLASSAGAVSLKLLDFGIAKALTRDEAMTASGALLGSPPFMSPEQIAGEPVDGRSDLWSLAVVFFQAITGLHPFAEDTVPATLNRICHGSPARVADVESGLPSTLDEFFRVAFARRPDARFQSAREFADAVQRSVRRARGLTAASAEYRAEPTRTIPLKARPAKRRRWRTYSAIAVSVKVVAA
jgi:serine/threonine protein kinase